MLGIKCFPNAKLQNFHKFSPQLRYLCSSARTFYWKLVPIRSIGKRKLVPIKSIGKRKLVPIRSIGKRKKGNFCVSLILTLAYMNNPCYWCSVEVFLLFLFFR